MLGAAFGCHQTQDGVVIRSTTTASVPVFISNDPVSVETRLAAKNDPDLPAPLRPCVGGSSD